MSNSIDEDKLLDFVKYSIQEELMKEKVRQILREHIRCSEIVREIEKIIPNFPDKQIRHLLGISIAILKYYTRSGSCIEGVKELRRFLRLGGVNI